MQRKAASGSKQALPSLRMSFEVQLKVLRAYGALARPAKNTELADALQINKATISDGNAFFLDVGFLKVGDGGYEASPEVVSYTHAYGWNPETAGLKLAPLIVNTWFHRALAVSTQVRSVPAEDAINTLAEASQAGPDEKRRLSILVELLLLAGLLNRNAEGKLEANRANREQGPAPTDTDIRKSDSVTKPIEKPDVVSPVASQQKPDRARLATLLLELAVEPDTPEVILESMWRVIKFLKGVKSTEPRDGTEKGGARGEQEESSSG